MHGRVKVRTSEEQKELERKEREKKVKVYKAAIQKVFSKRKNNELDDEGLEITGQILLSNPDIYTLWNYRKEIVLHYKELRPAEELEEVVKTELYLAESCLRKNPKSYCAWYHRCWILDNMPNTNWKRELAICNKYLDLDERNFHCWDYRRFVVKRANVSAEDELAYTGEKISDNFSNYSAWHLRSKLLPIVHPDTSQVGRPVDEKHHGKELDMVQSAAFTDPNDQSAWFYLRWLLGRVRSALQVSQVVSDHGKLCLRFSQPVSLGSLLIEGLGEDVKWTIKGNQHHSMILTAEVDVKKIAQADVISLKVSKTSGDVVESVKLVREPDETISYRRHFQFHADFSPALTIVLQDQLESCDQLLEFEPDSKWTALTSVLLMHALDRKKYKKEIMDRLEKLMKIDSLRTAYYSDLKSRYTTEYLLEAWEAEGCKDSLSLAGSNLTSLYHMECTLSVKELDLSSNLICSRSLPNLTSLEFCQVLNLDNNNLTSLVGFPHLPALRKLSLCENKLSEVESTVNNLCLCSNLSDLDLRKNPVAADERLVAALRDALSLSVFNGSSL
ncbi:geranylgeranyl transferase type-2 subunit alpha [Nilaparvata lugens]|uniref:geranylgeranyl transferase type-2 subunit alpha n=1 Tax=Nilaparvata lugens TaxID=108931 RepID=UPI00193DB807|nr:geranylgeranyl transferase type-2 subunit alpha [Nilaparvata lugens]